MSSKDTAENNYGKEVAQSEAGKLESICRDQDKKTELKEVQS